MDELSLLIVPPAAAAVAISGGLMEFLSQSCTMTPTPRQACDIPPAQAYLLHGSPRVHKMVLHSNVSCVQWAVGWSKAVPLNFRLITDCTQKQVSMAACAHLLSCAEDVVDEPVDGQAGGHIEGEPACRTAKSD